MQNADSFDPYHKWLGIPPNEQPASYYRLLGIADFESDPDVIQNAADRQMAHLRSHQSGIRAADSQRLLNEVATAKVCLLNAARRELYDQELRGARMSDFEEAAVLADVEVEPEGDLQVIEDGAFPSAASETEPTSSLTFPTEGGYTDWPANPAPPPITAPPEVAVVEESPPVDSPKIASPKIELPTASASPPSQPKNSRIPRMIAAISELPDLRTDRASLKKLGRSAAIGLAIAVVFGLLNVPILPSPSAPEEFLTVLNPNPDIVEDELTEEEDEELNEELEPTDSQSEDVVDEIVSSNDFEVDVPPEVPANSDGLELVMAQIEFNEMAIQSVLPGTLIDLGGSANSAFGHRTRARRPASVRRGGGGAATESAVEAALLWLAAHQNRDGSWSWNHTPSDKCSGYADPGKKVSKMGATGLALQAFLGAGYTHEGGSSTEPVQDNKAEETADDDSPSATPVEYNEYHDKYHDTVRKGLKYLVGNMIVSNNAGRLFEANGASHEHMYCHGIAACALVEAFGMTNDYSLQAPAQLAINYIVQAQHPENGGWLYTPRTGGDTSVVGWQVMALKSAILSYVLVPGKVKPLANKWLDSVQWDVPADGYGIGAFYGYRKPNDRPDTGATTAIGIHCRNYLGAQKGDPGLQKGIEAISRTGISYDNMYYNYYATQAMYQNDGPDGPMWKKWNKDMIDVFISSQTKAGIDRGSWFFPGGDDGGAEAGGRVYCTAMVAMMLEVYYRYPLIYQQKNVHKDDFPLE